jgi:hypothetical protein
MRSAPVGLLPEYFVTYEDSKGRYTEVNFEKKSDALVYIKKLAKRKVEAELWTRSRVFPEVR